MNHLPSSFELCNSLICVPRSRRGIQCRVVALFFGVVAVLVVSDPLPVLAAASQSLRNAESYDDAFEVSANVSDRTARRSDGPSFVAASCRDAVSPCNWTSWSRESDDIGTDALLSAAVTFDFFGVLVSVGSTSLRFRFSPWLPDRGVPAPFFSPGLLSVVGGCDGDRCVDSKENDLEYEARNREGRVSGADSD